MWEDRQLRDLTAEDIRELIRSGLQEHLQLEYKSEYYGTSNDEAKESLLDICQFANSAGGILLIGIREIRGDDQQPTGAPDPEGPIGIELMNPDAELRALDGRVISCIEETLHIESFPINMGDGRWVLAVRVPNSTTKPHSVRFRGHIYFPYRRERQRDHLDIRDIKEMVMRTASRTEDAEEKLSDAFLGMHRDDDQPRLLVGCIPIFSQEFMLDVQSEDVIAATREYGVMQQPRYNFTGLEHAAEHNSMVQIRRNGLIVLHRRLPRNIHNGDHRFYPEAIDLILRKFVIGAAVIFQAARISGPFLLGMMLRLRTALTAISGDDRTHVEVLGTLTVGDYPFPTVQANSLSNSARTIKPLCDQAHQMYGRRASPYFNADGRWNGPLT